jgi:hypothetical protein
MSPLQAHEIIAADTSASLAPEARHALALAVCERVAQGLSLEAACIGISPRIDAHDRKPISASEDANGGGLYSSETN